MASRYDAISLGHKATASVLAEQLPTDCIATSYLDLATGPGHIALKSIEVLRNRVPYLDVTSDFAVPAMLKRTKGNRQRHQLLQDPHVPVQLVSHYG